jgi:hypothetical protein
MTHAPPWLTIANLPLLQLRSTLGLPSTTAAAHGGPSLQSFIIIFKSADLLK